MIIGILVLLSGLAWSFFSRSHFVVKAGLNGEVTWTAAPGDEAAAGDALIRIRTLTGDAAAARAPDNGTVQEILVRPGDSITTGMVVIHMRKQ